MLNLYIYVFAHIDKISLDTTTSRHFSNISNDIYNSAQ